MTAATITEACGNCRFWRLARHGVSDQAARGHCCRSAPRGPAAPDAAPFPTTTPSQWCGEHESATWPGRLAQMEKEEGA